MPRPTTQLTDTTITKAKPKEKKYKLYDGGGLFLLVMPIGYKNPTPKGQVLVTP